MTKVDYLSLCNPQNAPEFGETVCVRCVQTECSRSLVGKSSFTKRVSDWEERLFKNPDRVTEDDPRFVEASKQKFISISLTKGTASEWVNPNQDAPVSEERPDSLATAFSPPAYNTPNKSKQMVGGQAASPVLDPWQPKQPLKPGETLVQNGAKIRLS